MAAPEYVPRGPSVGERVYESPPWKHDPWTGHVAGDLTAGQPRGTGFGNQGPDQGYVLLLAERFDDRLALRAGEQHDDAVAGCIGVALKRASLFGRAPVIHDLTVAFTIWGFMDAEADDALVAYRRPLFEEVADAHHYAEQRAIVDLVPEAALRQTPAQVADAYAAGWQAVLGVSPVASA